MLPTELKMPGQAQRFEEFLEDNQPSERGHVLVFEFQLGK